MSFVEQGRVRRHRGLVVRLWKETLGVEIRGRSCACRSTSRCEVRQRQAGPALRHAARRPHELVKQHQGGGVPLLDERQVEGHREGMRVPASANLSRTEIDKLEEYCAGWARRARPREDRRGRRVDAVAFAKSITAELRKAINEATGASRAISSSSSSEGVGRPHGDGELRVHLAKRMGLIPEYGSGGSGTSCGSSTAPLRVRRGVGHWAAAHHAFTRPRDQDLPTSRPTPARLLLALRPRAERLRDRGGSIRSTTPRCRPASSRRWISAEERGASSASSSTPQDGAPRTAGSRSAWTGS